MKRIKIIFFVLAMGFIATNAVAQNKVVVIPLSSSGGSKVAGTDMQVQYNDNGTQAGANVYYDKTTGSVSIGGYNSNDRLSVINESGNAGMLIFSLTDAYINMASLGGNKITMFSANDDVTNTQYPMIIGTKARGTDGAFDPVLSGDRLLGIFAKGQRNAGADPDKTLPASAGMVFIAAENWTDAGAGKQGGSYIMFFTTENNTDGAKAAHMIIDHNGNVGIGTTTPLSKLAVAGLPTAPPPADGSITSGIVCTTTNGNFWLDTDGTPDCAHP